MIVDITERMKNAPVELLKKIKLKMYQFEEQVKKEPATQWTICPLYDSKKNYYLLVLINEGGKYVLKLYWCKSKNNNECYDEVIRKVI